MVLLILRVSEYYAQCCSWGITSKWYALHVLTTGIYKAYFKDEQPLAKHYIVFASFTKHSRY